MEPGSYTLRPTRWLTHPPERGGSLVNERNIKETVHAFLEAAEPKGRITR
jgi:hypothetical protein